MHFYRAFDLTIASPIELPATRLNGPGPQVDVVIECQEYHGPSWPDMSPARIVTAAPDKIVMRWEHIGEFHLYDGKRIVIHRKPETTNDFVSLFLSGSVLAMLLFQRGMTVLHGSVVAVEGQGVAFVAPKGFGKSTLAMALHRMGAPLVSDDIVAIPATKPVPVVSSGFTQTKLWPDAMAELGYAADDHPRLNVWVDKRGVSVATDGQGALPLRHIFVLGWSDKLTCHPLEKNHALMALLPHWYVGRYGTETIKALAATGKPFMQCLELVGKIPVSVLARPQSLDELPRVVAAIWEHVVTTDKITDMKPPVTPASPAPTKTRAVPVVETRA